MLISAVEWNCWIGQRARGELGINIYCGRKRGRCLNANQEVRGKEHEMDGAKCTANRHQSTARQVHRKILTKTLVVGASLLVRVCAKRGLGSQYYSVQLLYDP